MRADLTTFVDDFRRHGDAAAIVEYRGNRRLIATWSQLAGYADRFATELMRREIPPGERVVLWGQNGLEWMGAFFGCVLRGVIVVPLDPGGAVDFAQRVVANTRPRLVVGDGRLLRELGGEPAQLSFEEFAEKLPQQPSGTNLREPEITLDTPFQILFTSGTTAEPKGIVHTHRNVLSNLDPIEREIRKYLKYERIFHPLRFLHTLPLSHVFGQFMGLWVPPLMAAEVHFENRLQAQRLIETIHRERISVLCSVPRVLDLLRSHLLAIDPKLVEEEQQAAGASQWRRWWRFRRIHRLFGYKFWAFVCGGAALSPELEGFWTTLSFILVQGYGMTETSALISLNHPFKPGYGTIGKVLPGRDVRISEEGEIQVRGDMVSQATWQNGALKKNESEWLATGDLAQRDDQGQLKFVGRRSQVIVTPAGVNVHPEDVEAALNAQTGVQASAVVPLLTPAGTEPMAVLLFRGTREQAQAAVVAANQQLAEYQQIHQWRLWPELDLPRTSTGKVRRPKVTEWVNAQPQQPEGGGAAEGDALLALILSISHANAGNTGEDARLSEDLGLDSLGRVQLQSELEQKLGLSLDDATLDGVVTLGDLRRALGLDRTGAASAGDEPEPSSARSAAGPARSLSTPAQGALRVREADEKDVYPRWPWSWPVRLLRMAYLELISQPLVRLLAGPRVERPPRLQPGGPVLIIANHVTAFDVPIILYGLPGRMRRRVATAMAGNILRDFRHMRNVGPQGVRLSSVLDLLGPAAWLLITALYNVFPLPRSAGFRRSFEHIGEALDRHYNVIVFPEGERTAAGLQGFRPGIGLLVRESGAPVVPVAMAGLSELKRERRWFRTKALTVRVGEPMEFSQDDTPEQITEKLYERLRGMLEER
ncbi:MAG TPA: AMP-binding protein [Acidobacteriaceae bacterium]|jgi:long-chain acyl-CoA synthetase|nr:AMP-binding protein [Acidobacteriaceae bacterium]